jgi:hypothetical protein
MRREPSQGLTSCDAAARIGRRREGRGAAFDLVPCTELLEPINIQTTFATGGSLNAGGELGG